MKNYKYDGAVARPPQLLKPSEGPGRLMRGRPDLVQGALLHREAGQHNHLIDHPGQDGDQEALG